MIDKTTPRAIRFYKNRPIVEIYKDYEIRQDLRYNVYEVIASVGICSYGATHIEDCRKFIDHLVNLGIKQDDDEEVSKYVFHIKPYDKVKFI